MSSESMPSNSVIFNITYITMSYETSLGDWNKNIYINHYFMFLFHCEKYLWTFFSLWKIPLNSSWKYFLNECIIICHIKCYFRIHWCFYSLLLFSCWVTSDIRPQGQKHARLPCPSVSPGVCSNLCPLGWWCHQAILSSVAPFSCPQSFPASRSISYFIHYVAVSIFLHV